MGDLVIKVRRRDFWIAFSLIVVFVGVGFVISAGVDPAVHGHGSIWTDDVTGNVGIGAGSPSNQLMVSGDVSILGDNPAQNVLTLRRAAEQTGHIMQWQRQGGVVLGVIDKDGNMGIGTDAPEATLHVVGDLIVDGTISGGFGGTPGNCVWQPVTWNTNEFCPSGKVVQGIDTCPRDGHRDICSLYCCDII